MRGTTDIGAARVYPDSPGHRGADTSIEAADAIAPSIGRVQRLVLDAVRGAGHHGLTADECAAALSIPRWTVQPRTTELKLKGMIRDSGVRRFNQTGKRARVWVAVPVTERGPSTASQPHLTLFPDAEVRHG